MPTSPQRLCYLETLLGRSFEPSNHLRFLKNGKEIFPAMLEGIRSAQSHIEFLTYIYWHGKVAEDFATALEDRAKNGVVVRVLLDGVGSDPISDDLIQRMMAVGVDVRWFRKMRHTRPWKFDNRTHRKILVIDGKIGFTGGVGIAEEWDGDARNENEWRDTHLRVEGSVVPALAAAFWQNWMVEASRPPELSVEADDGHCDEGGTEVLPVISSPSVNMNESAIMMAGLFEIAQERLFLQTPYFILEEYFRDLIIQKAERGLKIEIMVPGDHLDKRFEQWAREDDFEALLDAGVKLKIYQKTMLHAKVVLVDDDLASIGSCNLNQRSMQKDAEFNLIFHGTDINKLLQSHYDEDAEHCEILTDARYFHRNWLSTAAGLIMRPFREQL